MERLLSRGAEADIWLGDWMGMDAVYKTRTPKTYMLPEMDGRIRHARTAREAQLLVEAKGAGVETPTVYYVDLGRCTIVMEYVAGTRLKDALRAGSREMGASLGRLHRGGIVHGDPTTGNFVLRDGRLCVLDFGLASRSTELEDRAVDLHLVREAFSSAHQDVCASALRSFTDGYSEAVGRGAGEVLRRCREIERRGRYSRREWG
ncbi:MAG: Kae1-associated kinase Bud32 [Nitrososphaerota archaeon]|nr:Kae1-associated kinase Bud32 [Nitrososphaerota archaeon]MDG6939391.1 Kae1-associated kinase Bud32 [Nitrososphaerota archaeon]